MTLEEAAQFAALRHLICSWAITLVARVDDASHVTGRYKRTREDRDARAAMDVFVHYLPPRAAESFLEVITELVPVLVVEAPHMRSPEAPRFWAAQLEGAANTW